MYKITNREEVMSVGTNENLNNVNENIKNVKKIKDVENAVNAEKQVTQDTIDLQATQRIDFLDELKKDSSESAKQLLKSIQGDSAPQKSDEQSAQEEMPDEKVEQTQNVIEINENTQTEETKSDNQNQDQEQIIEKTEKEESEKIIEKIENKEPTAEEKAKKEKQHEQDKKDLRFERTLFARINVMQGKIEESLELIKKYERIDAKEGNLPNIVTTLHDKLTQEVIKQFRTVGIDFNMKSFLVQSIVSDLLERFKEGITEFRSCSENLNFVREVQEDFESRVELAPTSRVKTLFARIRGMFKPERKQEKLEQLERERQEQKLEKANIHLIKYKFINSELAKYTIKNNIVNSLTKEILHGQGSGLTLNINDFIDEKISPEMKKLGLENSLPDLHEKIYAEYKQKEDISKEEFEGMSVGELRKNMKLQKADILRSKIVHVVNTNKAVAASKEDDDERLAI